MDTNQHPQGCKCDNCDGLFSMQHHHHHWALKLLSIILIVLFAFWLGFQLGTEKGYIETRGYQSHSMMHAYPADYGQGDSQTFVIPGATNQ